MAIGLACRCGLKLQVAVEAAGTTITCPACGKSVPVPAMGRLEGTAPSRSVSTRSGPSARTLPFSRRWTMVAAILAMLGLLSVCLWYVLSRDREPGGFKLGTDLRGPLLVSETTDKSPSSIAASPGAATDKTLHPPADKTTQSPKVLTGKSPQQPLKDAADKPAPPLIKDPVPKPQEPPVKDPAPQPKPPKEMAPKPVPPPGKEVAGKPVPPPQKEIIGKPLELEWKLAKADVLYQELQIIQQPTYSIQGLPIKALIQYRVISKLTVESVDEKGNALVVQKVEGAQLGKADDLSRGMIAAALQKLPGTTFKIHLNARREVTQLDGGNNMIQVGGGNLLGGGFVQMTTLLERDAWKEFAQLTFFQPNRVLRPGEKWSNRMTHSWGALGTWHGMAHYIYSDRKENVHKFDYALQLGFVPGKQPGKDLGLITAADFRPPLAGGTFFFDAAKNRVIAAEERFRVKGAIAVSLLGQQTPVEIEEDQLIGIRIHEQMPK